MIASSTMCYKKDRLTWGVLMRRSCTGALLIAACWTCATSEAHAGKHWIATYIDAQGGCASPTGPLGSLLAGGGLQAPFGRPGADWSDDDLAELPRVLAECERTAARTNNPFLADEVKHESQNILSKVPGIVHNARAERERQEAQLTAQKEIAQGRISSANKQAEQRKAAAEAEVRQLEAEADRTEAEAKRAAESQDQARRAAQDRIARAETEGRRSKDSSNLPDERSSRQGFSFSESELMRRFATGSTKAVVLPVLRNEMQNDEVRTHIYEVGRANMLYTFEYKADSRVRDFALLLAPNDEENTSLGLLLFGASLDVVSPGLTSNDRSNIIMPMLKRVVQDHEIYEKDMKTYNLKCMKMKGVFCAFTPK